MNHASDRFCGAGCVLSAYEVAKENRLHCLEPHDAVCPSCFHVQIVPTLFAEDIGKLLLDVKEQKPIQRALNSDYIPSV